MNRKYANGGPTKSTEEVKKLQSMLKEKGLYNGKIDGIYGPNTKKAYETSLKQLPENIQYVGGRGFDSNGVRQGDFGELIATDIRTKEDFGVVRQPNGKYKFYEEKTVPLKEVEVTAGYNIPANVQKQKEIALQEGKTKNFSVIDKLTNHMYYFDPSGKTLGVETVITGKSRNDKDRGMSMKEFFKANNTTDHEAYFQYLEENKYQTTPTGHFTIGQRRENVTKNPDKIGSAFNSMFRPEREALIEANRTRDYGRAGSLFTLLDDNGVAQSKAIHGTASPIREQALADATADRNLSNGCINVNGESICFNVMEPGSEVYVTNGYEQVRKQPKSAPKPFAATKRKVAQNLDKAGIPYDDDKLSFIAAVSEKETEGGRGRFAQIENAFPYLSKSTGDFQINPETFTDYLPENYSGDYKDQVKAVANFYDKTTGSPVQRYSLYNGADSTSVKVQSFNEKFNQMKKTYVTGGEIGNVLSTAAPLVSMIPGWGTAAGIGLGLAGGMLQNNEAQKEMKPALPGYRYPGYAAGGAFGPGDPMWMASTYQGVPLKFDTNKAVPRQGYGNMYTVLDVNSQMYYDVQRNQTDGSYSVHDHPRFEQAPDLSGYGGNSSKSKSRERFREKATGGEIDQQLSSNSFKVQGAPNQTDGNFYPDKGVYLDHDEVVKDNFVFSDDLMNPYTNKSFAETATKLEKSTGKAEKKMKRYNDNISNTTANLNNKMLSSLAQTQESLATSLGLRNDSQHLANGGPYDPHPSQPYIEIGAGKHGVNRSKTYYYDPYNNRVLTRFKDGSYGLAREGAANEYELPSTARIQQHLSQYPVNQTMRVPNDMAVTDKYPSMRTEGVQIPGIPQQPQTPPQPFTGYDPFGGLGTPQAPPVTAPTVAPRPGAVKPLPKKQGAVTTPQATGPLDPIDLRDPSRIDSVDTIPYFKTPQVPFENQGNAVYSNRPYTPPNIQGLVNTQPTVPTAATNTNRMNFTAGDALQAVELGSKFIDAFGKPQKEPRYMDGTNITRPTYDPSVVLQSNERNYQNAVNSISTNSPTLRRALANNMYASKMTSDSETLGRYQEMNNQARVGYEDRLSNRNRFNIQQGVQTNDLNSRNRGAQDAVQQNAFESLGNFGQMLNQKKYGYDSLGVLKEMYPDVYDRIISSYG